MSSNHDEMHISEAELASLTEDLTDAHNETLPKMRSAAAEWAEANAGSGRSRHPSAGGPGELPGDPVAPTPRSFSRRRFLVTSGITAAGGLVLAACGSSTATPAGTTGGTSSTTAPGGGGSAPVDVQVAALAASLENLAVATYEAGIKAAVAGKLGKVPPAVAKFATTAMAQHKDHAAGWNAILSSAGYKPVTSPDPVVKTLVDHDFSMVKDIAGLAGLALTLENVAAATYLNALTVVSSQQSIETAATIQPVEMQHAAILNFVLGKYPVPMAFASTTGARPITDFKTLVKA